MRNIKQFFTRLFRPSKAPKIMAERSSDTAAQKMMAMISNTAEVELTCDEVFELLDQFTEMARRGENVAQLMPLVQHHLGMCPDCREEYEALKRVLEHG